MPGDLTALTWIVVAFLVHRARLLGRDLRADLPGRLDRPARAAGPAHPALRAPAERCRSASTRASAPGVLISRLSNDVEALDTLVTRRHRDAVRLVADADRHRRDPVHARRRARADHLHGLPDPRASRRSPSGSSRADAYRATREKVAAITAYLQETLSGIRVVRSFAQEPRHLEQFEELNEENRVANMKTVHLNAAYFPGVELLSAIATAGHPLLRRHPGRSTARSRSASWSPSWPR